jgi:CubicO group peptidase (beta-lactamase class C family)
MTVRGVVDAAIASGEEIGEEAAACVDGELVVDIAAGVADVETGTPLDADTLVLGLSVGKGLAATVAVLVEHGCDTPVAEYWPEFARRGEDEITVGHVLSQSIELAYLPPNITPETLPDQGAMTELLAACTNWLVEPPMAAPLEPVTAGVRTVVDMGSCRHPLGGKGAVVVVGRRAA